VNVAPSPCRLAPTSRDNRPDPKSNEEAGGKRGRSNQYRVNYLHESFLEIVAPADFSKLRQILWSCGTHFLPSAPLLTLRLPIGSLYLCKLGLRLGPPLLMLTHHVVVGLPLWRNASTTPIGRLRLKPTNAGIPSMRRRSSFSFSFRRVRQAGGLLRHQRRLSKRFLSRMYVQAIRAMGATLKASAGLCR
jgi:hypothetical protein